MTAPPSISGSPFDGDGGRWRAARPEDLVISGIGEARFCGRRLPCSLGRGGRRLTKREGDGATPVGVFRLEYGFYRADRGAPPTGATPFRRMALWDGWSDSPNDPAYNQKVRRPHALSHERLWRADRLYDLVLVMDANRNPVVPGCGSALFIHLWRGPRRPTEGCVAFARADLTWILARWTARSRVVIRR